MGERNKNIKGGGSGRQQKVGDGRRKEPKWAAALLKIQANSVCACWSPFFNEGGWTTPNLLIAPVNEPSLSPSCKLIRRSAHFNVCSQARAVIAELFTLRSNFASEMQKMGNDAPPAAALFPWLASPSSVVSATELATGRKARVQQFLLRFRREEQSAAAEKGILPLRVSTAALTAEMRRNLHWHAWVRRADSFTVTLVHED